MSNEPGGGPQLKTITPSSGGSGGGESVTLAGSLLLHVVGVSFGGSPATGIHPSQTEVTCTTPAHTPGVVDVTATDDEGNVSNPVKYQYK